MQAKLDELLVASGRARNALAGSEKLAEEEIEVLRIRKEKRDPAEPPVSRSKTKQIVD
jgi:low affinity Fe/Cu permease